MVLKAVFDVHSNSKYSDDISRRFEFIARENNLVVAKASVNDWVVFRETRSGPKSGYIGIARVSAIKDASAASRMAYAVMTDYLAFPHRAPLKKDGRHIESRFLGVPRQTQIGVMFQQNPMRSLFDADFAKIVRLGFGSVSPTELLSEPIVRPGFEDEGDLDAVDIRRIEEVLLRRAFRDRVFRENVGYAWNFRCALTGLRLSDGFGHFEAQAAHLCSVANGGPDIVFNGLCVFATGHWLVDHHVVSISDDHRLMTVPHLIPPDVAGLLVPSGHKIHLPNDKRLWPHAKYLEAHRAKFLALRGR